jgi:CHAT domain-containing protein/tetratricopeptide (TPR) repeat protein/predicted Ser/Thr protein kinase
MTPPDHPRREELDRFLVGNLPGPDLEQVADHLESCGACQQILPAQVPADALVVALRRPLEPEPHSDEPECGQAVARLEALAAPGSGPDGKAVAVSPPAGGPLGPMPITGHWLGDQSTPQRAAAGPVFEHLPYTFGRYQVLQRLGQGGMGAVYLARDTTLDRRVALKLSRRQPQEGSEGDNRFLREARAAAGLQHEGICPVYDYGVTDGIQYITMAYIQGRPLSEVLRGGQPLEPRRAADLVRRVALALEAAHRQGVIHRDLKPSNIMLNDADRPTVVDFGLARREQDPALTQTGVVVGTPLYMSPEQISGGSVDCGTDIYCLGVILYEMLTGRRPFAGVNQSQLTYHIVHVPPAAPRTCRPDLDPRLEAICLRASAKDARDRYATMAEMAAALEDYLSAPPGTPASPPPEGEVPAGPVGPAAEGQGPAKLAIGRERSDTVVRSDLPTGASVRITVSRPGGAPGQVTVTVREQEEKRRKRRRWAIRVTVAFTILFAVLAAIPILSSLRLADEAWRSEAEAKRDEALRMAIRLHSARRAEARASALDHNRRGLSLMKEGRSEEAVAAYRMAIRLQPDFAEAHLNLGLALQAKEDLAGAVAAYREAIRLQPDYAFAYNNLGEALRQQGKLREARPYMEEALAIRRKALGEGHPDYAQSLNNLAGLYHHMGDYKALPLYERALEVTRKALGEDHPDYAASLNNLGAVLQSLGEPGKARTYYERALAVRRKALPPGHPDIATSLNRLGVLLCEQGEEGKAWGYVSEAAATWAAYTAQVSAGSAQRDHAALTHYQRCSLFPFLSMASQAPTPSAFQREAVLAAILDAKAVSAWALRLRQEAVLLGNDPEAARLWNQLKPVRQRLASLLLQGPGRLPPERYRARWDELQKEHDDLERALASRVKAYAELRRAERGGPAAVADALHPGAVLVEIIRYDRSDFRAKERRNRGEGAHYLAVLLWRGAGDKGGAQVRLVPLGPARDIDRAVHSWLGRAKEGVVYDPVGRDLRRLVWEPLEKALPEGAAQLYVAPDGELALLPLEALRLADDSYLVERVAVSYLGSGRDLLPRPLPKGRSDLALIVSDPDYDHLPDTDRPPPRSAPTEAQQRSSDFSRQEVRFKALPGSAREADAVAKLLEGRPGWRVRLARGIDASEEALAAAARPRLLYCATHGFFLPDLRHQPEGEPLWQPGPVDVGPGRWRLPPGDDPRLRSGLALAGANRWKERAEKGLRDGLLTAREVEDLDLWGAELVVLSACETGPGEVEVGAGVLGLWRAFRQAGAQTVLASRWKVPDVEAERLLTAFFRRWLKGAGKAEALREAQLELIKELRASKEARHREAPPLYWAGFICHGQP